MNTNETPGISEQTRITMAWTALIAAARLLVHYQQMPLETLELLLKQGKQYINQLERRN